MPNSYFAFALFLSSYSPAFLILAVRAWHRSTTLVWVCLGLTLISAGAFLLFIRFARQGGAFRATVDEIEPRDADLAAYVATYLLPFLAIFGPAAQDLIALGLFLVFIGLLWINSDMVYLNPLLAALGYHVYVVRLKPTGTEEGGALQRSFVLTHQDNLRVGDEVRPDRIGRNVFIDLTVRG